MKIPFNVPLVLGEEFDELKRVLNGASFAGNGPLSRECAKTIADQVGCAQAIMTSSCTDALEMSALLCDIEPGDEVIMPSYTFISTASAFALRNASIVWCDIRLDTKNIDERKIESLITERTKAVVVVHYGGVACEMDAISDICRRHGLLLVEDAAQGVGCFYKGKPLGSMGDLATFSFHETKNFQCGEGGALLVNNKDLVERAEILRDKGTNRARFLRGQVDKYTWIDLGSSFLMSELQAGFLRKQLSYVKEVNRRRQEICRLYDNKLGDIFSGTKRLNYPESCQPNGHLFYVLFESLDDRINAAERLARLGVTANFHYLPLHKAPVWRGKYNHLTLPITEMVSDCLLRMPLFYTLTNHQVEKICSCVHEVCS